MTSRENRADRNATQIEPGGALPSGSPWTADGPWTLPLDRQIQLAMRSDPDEPFWPWVQANFDPDAYAAIQRDFAALKYATQSKFLDARMYLSKKLRDVRTFPKRSTVLDLGCGPGHVGVVGRYRGHEVIGLDVPGQRCFAAQCLFWGTPVIEHTITAFEPLPRIGTFDVVCAYLIKFGLDWGEEEWKFFIDDCRAIGRRVILDVPGARVKIHKFLGERCDLKYGARKFVFVRGDA